MIREALRRYEDAVPREQARLAALNRLADEGDAAYARGDYVKLTSRQELRDFIRKAGTSGRSEGVA